MPNLLEAKRRPAGGRSRAGKLRNADIQRRLESIELATVSSVRALQMDLDRDDGVPSEVVMKRARAALK